MMPQDISRAKNPDLRGSLAAIRRAAEEARRIAIQTTNSSSTTRLGRTATQQCLEAEMKTFFLTNTRLLALCLCLPLSAMADVSEIRAGFDCQPGRDRLILTYDSASNHPAEKMAEKASATQWNPGALVTYDDEDHIDAMRAEQGVCRLSDGEYQVEILPYPGNGNLQGMCGAWMGASAIVKKDGKTRFDAPFDDSCHRPDQPVIRRVLIRPGKATLIRTTPSGSGLGLMFTAACQPAHYQLRLGFVFGATHIWREEPPGVNDIESLLAYMDGSDNYKPHDIEASCRLRDGEYRYVLHPLIPEGKGCGAAKWASARLTIAKDGEIIHDAPFMQDCGNPEAPVVTSVTLRSGKKPKVETQPAALFYDPDDDASYRVYESESAGE
ncbi:MAG: hypothetical protein LBD06_01050 [Candidatus Accumulibacter sp.]|jgi:hypothetical protein|nr:hypothetical protein [Accumulibacter sp.]